MSVRWSKEQFDAHSELKAIRKKGRLLPKRSLHQAVSSGKGKKLADRKCKICKEKFTPRNFAQPTCFKAECILAYTRKLNEKRNIEESKVKIAGWKDKVTDYKKLLQDEINKIVRLIDAGLRCLARDNVPNLMAAGHVYARGGNQSMRYNLHNIHRQSAQSNHYQSDDGLLREGIVKEYGQTYMDFISDLRATPELKYSNLEYKEFLAAARQIVKELKRESKTYSLIQRINLRNKFNTQLNIYSENFCNFNY